MSIKSIAAKLFAQKIYRKPNLGQTYIARKKSFTKINQASTTQFGIDHHFDQI
jgi:hypothetical protein